MLLIASLSVDFCWDWANHSNPTLGTSEDDEKDFLMSSQMAEKELTQSKSLLSDRWGSPKSSGKLDLLRKDGIPKSTEKQTVSLSWRNRCLATYKSFQFHIEELLRLGEDSHRCWHLQEYRRGVDA